MKLVLFDVDGTLIDSQHAIVTAMETAAQTAELPPPSRAQTLGIVGLSLDVAIARLYPDRDHLAQARMVEAYKHAYMSARDTTGAPAVFPGALDAIRALAARVDVLLGTATGMSLRGMDRILDAYDLRSQFATIQTADTNPSKPDPAMVLAALRDTGVAAQDAVFVGDTTYDIGAGQAAGIFTIGVTWGYHAAENLHGAGADRVVDRFSDLVPTIDELWSL